MSEWGGRGVIWLGYWGRGEGDGVRMMKVYLSGEEGAEGRGYLLWFG